MLKKIFTLLVISQLWHASIYAQPTYVNAKYTLGYLATVITGIYPTDSCVYVKGIMTDSLFRAGSFFSKVSLDGQFLRTTELIDSSALETNTWFTPLIRNTAGNFLVAGYLYDTNFAGFVAEYTPGGALIRFNQFRSPYYPGDGFIVPIAIAESPQGGYVLTGNLSNQVGKSAFLARLDTTLQVMWIKTYGSNLYEGSYSLLVDPAGNITFGGMEHTNFIYHNIVCRKTITQVDSSGDQLLWTWKFPAASLPPIRGWVVNDMLPLADGSIIGASAISKEEIVNAENSILLHSPSIFKLKPDHSLDWETPIGNGLYTEVEHEFLRVVKATDGNGYVAAASLYIPDSTASSIIIQLGMLAKVAENGDSLWMRYLYYYTDSTTSRNHYITDLATAPNGGYWICGQMIRPSTTEPYQQGWLLRVDEHGCLVPGCQSVGVTPEVSLADQILLYPNPASDHLTIYHAGHDFRRGQFRIVDVSGRILRSWVAPANELSTVFDLTGFGAGTFFLQYLEAGNVLADKQFVIVR